MCLHFYDWLSDHLTGKQIDRQTVSLWCDKKEKWFFPFSSSSSKWNTENPCYILLVPWHLSATLRNDFFFFLIYITLQLISFLFCRFVLVTDRWMSRRRHFSFPWLQLYVIFLFFVFFSKYGGWRWYLWILSRKVHLQCSTQNLAI